MDGGPDDQDGVAATGRVTVHVPDGAACALVLDEGGRVELAEVLAALVAAGLGAPGVPDEGPVLGVLELGDGVTATVDGRALGADELAGLAAAGVVAALRDAVARPT